MLPAPPVSVRRPKRCPNQGLLPPDTSDEDAIPPPGWRVSSAGAATNRGDGATEGSTATVAGVGSGGFMTGKVVVVLEGGASLKHNDNEFLPVAMPSRGGWGAPDEEQAAAALVAGEFATRRSSSWRMRVVS